MTVRPPVRLAGLLLAGTLAVTACTGDRNSDQSSEKPRPVTELSKKYGEQLADITVNLGNDSPKAAAEASTRIGKALQAAGIVSFSLNSATAGTLVVQVTDPITDENRDSLVKQLSELDKDWNVKATEVDGWAFRLVGPLPEPVDDGLLPKEVGEAVSREFATLLPSGYQLNVVDSGTAALIFAGPLPGGESDIERARAAFERALDAPAGAVKAETAKKPKKS